MVHGYKCDFKGQNNKELLVGVVAEVIVKLVSNPRFVAMMQKWRWTLSNPNDKHNIKHKAELDEWRNKIYDRIGGGHGSGSLLPESQKWQSKQKSLRATIVDLFR